MLVQLLSDSNNPTQEASQVQPYVLALPSIFAIVLWALSPVLTYYSVKYLKNHVRNHSAKDKDAANPSNAMSVDQLDNYGVYVSDLVQIPAAGLLPIIGASIGLATRIDTVTGIVIIAVIGIITFLAFIVVGGMDPSKYANRKYPIYLTFVPCFAIVINFICGVAFLCVAN